MNHIFVSWALLKCRSAECQCCLSVDRPHKPLHKTKSEAGWKVCGTSVLAYKGTHQTLFKTKLCDGYASIEQFNWLVAFGQAKSYLAGTWAGCKSCSLARALNESFKIERSGYSLLPSHSANMHITCKQLLFSADGIHAVCCCQVNKVAFIIRSMSDPMYLSIICVRAASDVYCACVMVCAWVVCVWSFRVCSLKGILVSATASVKRARSVMLMQLVCVCASVREWASLVLSLILSLIPLSLSRTHTLYTLPVCLSLSLSPLCVCVYARVCVYRVYIVWFFTSVVLCGTE